MGHKMETTVVHWGYIGRMENGSYYSTSVYIGVIDG